VIIDFIKALISKELLVPSSCSSISKIDHCFSDEISQCPDFAVLEVTTRCNFRCLHCYLGEERRKPVDLPTQVIDAMTDDFLSMGLTRIQITGGEPLIRNDALDMIERMSRRFRVDLTTNGSLIGPEAVERLVCLDSMQISVYGFSALSFRNFTGVDGEKWLPRLCDNIIRIKRKGIRLSLAYIVTPQNKGDIPGFVSFCRSHDIAYRLGFSMPVGACRDNMAILSMDQDAKKALLLEHESVPTIVPVLKRYSCAPSKLMVLADGRVLACGMLRDKGDAIYGNVHVGSIRDVWRRGVSAFAETVEVDRVAPCSGCELRYACGGVCPALRGSKFVGSTKFECPIYNGQGIIFRQL
jgi:radical SAM protein with 4Fe4S-binding SPASM domain